MNNQTAKLAPVRVNPVLLHPQERRMKLDGEWRFRLDADDRGLKKRWFENGDVMTDPPILVPGCWQGQGFGASSNDEVWDFRLQTRTLRATYKGTGWYAKLFRIPNEWQEKRLWLNFGGAHPSAEVWLNGTRLGENNLPFVPFGFEITGITRIGGDNNLVVRVHERHREFGFSYNWQGNWSGLYRGVEITATGESFLERFSLYPDVDKQELRIVANIGGFRKHPLSLRIAITPAGETTTKPVAAEFTINAPDFTSTLAMPSPRLWSPDAPNLYRVEAELTDGKEIHDAQSERAGFVKLAADGHRFLINDEPYYIRGTGDFISCPETGCPDTDRDRWRHKLKTLREYGYNQVRCQSFVYGPEYYDVADEVGLLVQSEMGMLGAWSGHSIYHVYPWPQPMASNRETLRKQWNHIVLRDVNHPSANIYCMSNELANMGNTTFYPRTAWQCYNETKAIKPTAFVIWTDGGYNENLPGDFVNAPARVSEKCDKPVIQHEFRWWSSFPDVRIRQKYSGAVRPYAAEIALEAAARQGLAHLLPEFADKSQRLQLLEAKVKMENCRRDHPRLAGISHFNAMDANPSPQGIIDEFYERKLADASTWIKTNGDTVILSSLGFDDRVLCVGNEFKCKLFVSDFSHPPMTNPVLEWRLKIGDEIVSSGKVGYSHKPYCTHPVGEISLQIPLVPHPKAAHLEAFLRKGNRVVTNSWDVWIFPRASLPKNVVRYEPEQSWISVWNNIPVITAEELSRDTTRVVLTERLDESLAAFMRNGGRVIMAAGEGLVRPHGGNGCGSIGYFFTPGANYGPYEDGQNGTIIRAHPMFGCFPHEGFADFQFFRLMNEAPPIELKPLDLADDEPAIRVIHRYPVCHSLGYLLERSLGQGGIILTSLDLSPAFPEARWMLANICSYAAGADFHPERRLSDQTISQLVSAAVKPEGFNVLFSGNAERFDLPAHWRIFGPVARNHAPLSKEQMAIFTESLTIDGERLSACEAEAGDGRLNLAPYIGGTADGKTAYVFIPFETKRELKLRFGFGADWWFAAFLDGAPFLDSLDGGNQSSPIRATNFTKITDLAKGRHLLAIRFISGSSGSILHVAAWHASDAPER